MRWTARSAEPDSSLVTSLQCEAQLHPLIARLLAARGVRSVEEAACFLSPALSHLHSPFAMLGMDVAVARLEAAIAAKEKVLIYGDYDVDGTVAIVLLRTALELCGGAAGYHVPHRVRDGYGMKDQVIEQAAADGVRLIISVDTGIRAFAAAEAAARAGVDLIVTDHHLPESQEGVPRALAVLNPNQAGCGYPCKGLCGAGVAFKLAQALLQRAGQERLLPSFLKMVALATIADAVPLAGENRVIARLGLEGLRRPANAGLKALMEVASLDPAARPLTATDVAFRLAPRLNAAGRMDVARDVIELFSCSNQESARAIAMRLDRLNGERQQEEHRIVKEIFARLDADPEVRHSHCLVVEGEGWHRGVIGIVATRVVERYGRPALVVSTGDGEAHGSGRSIPGFHLLEALESCRQLFERFGGHAAAVGCTLPATRLPELRSALEAFARARLTEDDFAPSLALDAELSLEEITPQLHGALQQLAPFGVGNPEPVFAARGVRLLQPPRLLKDIHVKLRVAASSAGRSFDALGWRMAERIAPLSLVAGDSLDIAFTVEENTHPDFGGLQLELRDVAKIQKLAAV